MMRTLLAFVILLGAVYLGLQLHYDMGYVLIRLNHWTLETTFWVALFGLILFVLLLQFLIQCLYKIAKAPRALKLWHSKHLSHKAQTLTKKGLIEYSEGYWNKARRHLIAALPHTDMPLINYLTAAKAAQKMGDNTLRDNYLREAQQSMPDAKVAVELTQAQLQLANHQWEQALATLKHLQDLAPNHPYVLKLLMQLHIKIKDWLQLIDLLPLLKKHQVISPEDYAELEARAYLQSLKELTKLNLSNAATAFYSTLPKPLKSNHQLVAEYTGYLIQQSEYDRAENLLQPCLRKEYSTQLVAVYSLLPGNEKQLQFAESLLKKNPHCAQLHLYLGELCMQLHLWGKAKMYLEQAIQLHPTGLAYFKLGQLHEKLNDALLASMHYKKGLALSCDQIGILGPVDINSK